MHVGWVTCFYVHEVGSMNGSERAEERVSDVERRGQRPHRREDGCGGTLLQPTHRKSQCVFPVLAAAAVS